MNRWCSIPYWSLGRFHNVRLMMMMTRQRLEKKKKKKTTKLKSSLVRVCLGQRQSLCLWRYLWRYKAKGIKRETYSPSIRRNICDSVDPFWPESKSSVNTTLPFNGNIKIKMMARLKLFTFIFKFDIFSGVAFVALDYFTMHRQVSQSDRQSTYTLELLLVQRDNICNAFCFECLFCVSSIAWLYSTIVLINDRRALLVMFTF